MDRLLNIDRQGGFPVCAETLGILDENSKMLAEWLKQLPLKNRQAVMLGGGHLLVCHNLQKKVVKMDSNSAASISQCRLEFRSTNRNVEDGNGNTFYNVWVEERADIVNETDPGAQWTILSPWDVFELKLWYDHLPAFEAGLAGFTVSDGSFVSAIALYEDNILHSNSERVKIRLNLSCVIRARKDTVLTIPFPCECPDGTRVETDIEYNGGHYPVRAYIGSRMLRINIGRWLKDEDLFAPDLPLTNMLCNIIIRINKEVVL